MGTSSSYGGPKGKNPLLPKDFEDNGLSAENGTENQNNIEDNQANNNISISQNTELWKTVKTLTSKLATGTVKNKRSVLSKYVKAHGGARKAASSAKAGKATAVKFGSFISGISSNGIQKTFSQLGIEYEGKSVEEILSEIVNKIAPTGNTKEEVVARNAIIDVLEILYEEIEKHDNDLTSLEKLNEKDFNNVMRKYISSYIFQRFLNDLESRFEKNAENTDSALQIENDIKEYISGVVDNKLKGQNFAKYDYSSTTIQGVIENIYIECYEVIEDIL